MCACAVLAVFGLRALLGRVYKGIYKYIYELVLFLSY